MDTRLTALVIGLLLAGSSAAGAGQTKTVEPPPRPAGTLRGRTQIQVQPDRMPKLVGQTFQEARLDSDVRRLKLQLDGVRRPTNNQRPGVIVDQDPAPGSAIRPGMQVTVYVAVLPPQPLPPDPREGGRLQSGPGPTNVQRMPKLVGQLFDRALQDSGVVELKLRLIRRERPTSGQRPGIIIDQEPSPGDVVRPGSTVIAVVAVAVPPERVEVPRVVTMQAKDGASLLARRTLNTQEQFTETARAEPGTIVDQKPSPGTLVAQNSTVQIVVARRPPPPPPPDPNQGKTPNPVAGVRVPQVEGMEVRQGMALVSDFNLSARAQTVETDRAPPGTIVDQNPEAGTLVVPPYTVTVFVARRPPLPPPPRPPEDAGPPPPPQPKLFPMPDSIGRVSRRRSATPGSRNCSCG